MDTVAFLRVLKKSQPRVSNKNLLTYCDEFVSHSLQLFGLRGGGHDALVVDERGGQVSEEDVRNLLLMAQEEGQCRLTAALPIDGSSPCPAAGT